MRKSLYKYIISIFLVSIVLSNTPTADIGDDIFEDVKVEEKVNAKTKN